MKKSLLLAGLAGIALAGVGVTAAVEAQTAKTGKAASSTRMSFFISSVGGGKGADLGGLAGADAHCAKLAKAAGSTRKTWRAYLSTSPTADRTANPPVFTPGVNARDRIGNGPWRNAKGVVVAKNVSDLHSGRNKLTKATALDETGKLVNGRSEKPNRHDILTGSDPAGMYSTAGGDTTCGNWTKSGDDGSAIVGHHDREGLNKQRHMLSWNSAHGSRGCSQPKLQSSGGDAFVYCFSPN